MKKYEISLLYIEEKESIRDKTIPILENCVSDLIIAKDGEEALNLFKEYNPDLVITAIKIPKLNGLELSHEIKNINKHTRIIIASAYKEVEYLMDAIKIGIDSYLTHPIIEDELIAIIEKMLK